MYTYVHHCFTLEGPWTIRYPHDINCSSCWVTAALVMVSVTALEVVAAGFQMAVLYQYLTCCMYLCCTESDKTGTESQR